MRFYYKYKIICEIISDFYCFNKKYIDNKVLLSAADVCGDWVKI